MHRGREGAQGELLTATSSGGTGCCACPQSAAPTLTAPAVHFQVQALRSIEPYLQLEKLYVLGTNCTDNGPRQVGVVLCRLTGRPTSRTILVAACFLHCNWLSLLCDSVLR